MTRRELLLTAVVAVVLMAAIGVIIAINQAGNTDSASPTPTTTLDGPGPDGSDDSVSGADNLEEFVPQAVEFVEQVRGQAFLYEPTVIAMPEDEFVARVAEVFAEDFEEDPKGTEEIDVVYGGLGLIDADETIEDVFQVFAEAGVLGFYDPETEELVVRQADELSLMTKSTIVHELVHAFDDQHFDLTREYDDGERGWTFSAVLEGNASAVDSAWARALTSEEQAALQAEELSFGDPSIALEFELAFLLLQLSPYQEGEPYIDKLVAKGGQAAVDADIMDPPVSSEQIMAFGTANGDDEPVEVEPPPADGDIVTEGPGGQVMLDSLFTGAGADFTGEAAQGWGGDWLVAWRDGDQRCVRWDVVGDTANDTAEIQAGFERYADRYGGSVGVGTDTEVGQAVRFERCA